MSLRSIIKGFANALLSPFGKDFLLEYWQIKRNEKSVLAPISQFYSGFIKPGMKIIDVGTNIGNYSQVFLELGANVIGMEPQAYCRKILRKRFQGQNRFLLIPAAAGPSVAKGKIRKSASHTIASMNENWIQNVKLSRRFFGEDWVNEEEIEITTLDKVIKENFQPEYIKIDVEGFELGVLKGLHTAVNLISFEITLPEMRSSAIDCINEIAGLGNYVFVVPEQNLRDIKIWKDKAEILIQIEQLCTSSEKVSSDIFCKKVES